MSVVKPKGTKNKMDQSEIEPIQVISIKRGKTCAGKLQLVLV